MNAGQRIVLAVGAVVVVMMLLVPPWMKRSTSVRVQQSISLETFHGYAPIFDSPESHFVMPMPGTPQSNFADLYWVQFKPNAFLLAVQLVGVALVAGALILALSTTCRPSRA